MIMKYDAVIIGSGLGGLQCPYILARHGLKVCLVEKNRQPGGCLQTFRRGEHIFDTGFHYVGGLADGQPLNRLLRYFGLTDLPWIQLDESGFDEVILNGAPNMFASGYDRFVDTMAQQFPHERYNLQKFAQLMQNVSEHIFDSMQGKKDVNSYGTALFSKSAFDYLASTFTDPLIRSVLSGTSLKMELIPQTLPLYVFAQINGSYIQSAWRLAGGASQIVNSLTGKIRSFGGDILLNAEVTSLTEDNGKITAAVINRSEKIEARYFIAGIHPLATFALIPESRRLRNIYRRRIAQMTNTYGIFTVNIILKKHSLPYLNRNIYVLNTDDLWKYSDYKPENVNTCAMVSFRPPEDGSGYTGNVDVLTPMYWD